MRRRFTASLSIAAILLTTAGCRQTTGPMTGGPIPAGPAPPSALSPMNPGQAPILGPLGGNTRVTPPATGSYQPTSAGFTSAGFTGAATFPTDPPSLSSRSPIGNATGNQTVVGSGVQVAGWTETNSQFSGTANLEASQVGVAPTYGSHPSTPSDPRSGGMQVIDLTNAPAPPGYRPAYQPAPVIPPRTQPQTFNVIPNGTNAYSVQSATAPLPATVPVTNRTPQSSFQAQAVTEVPSSSPTTRGVLGDPRLGPSTQPIQPGDPSNLMWRRPGSQYP